MYIQNLDEVLPILRGRLRDYLTLKLGLRSNAKKFSCFVHKDGEPSMWFNPKTHEETVHCFGCGADLDLFGCAEKIDGLPSSGPEWITETIPALCELLEIPLKIGEVSIADKERLRLLKIAQDISDCLLENSPEDIPYVETRNWKQPYLSYGWVEEEMLVAKVMERGWTAEEIAKSLLVKTKYVNYFGKDKVTFVIKDHRGRAIGFIYKDISKPDGRYVNSSDSQIYNKSKALLGIETAIKTAKTDGIIIVEGPGDLAALNRVGITNAVAICGTAFTEYHLLYLKSLGIQKINLCLDWDQAGFAATSRILEDVLKATSNISVFVTTAPTGNIKDPDELLRKSKTTEPFTSLKVLTGFEWKLQQLKDEAPGDICETMVPIIASEPMAVRREMLIRQLSDFTDVTMQAIQTDVKAIIDDKFNKYKDRIVATAEQALQEIKEDPENIRTILAQQEDRVAEIENELEQNSIGINSQLMRLDILLREISGEGCKEGGGFVMNCLTNIKRCFDGGSSWAEGCLISLPGKAHSGKTAMALAISADIALSDENALVIVYSTDDSYKLILPRLISNLYHFSFPDGPQLTNGMIAQPSLHLPDSVEHKNAYQEAQKLLRFLISEERLIVIDGDSGRTVSTLQKQLRYYRKRFPGRKIFCVLDNQFNLQDKESSERSQRIEWIINNLKDTCEDYKCCLLVTAEYKKRLMGGQDKLIWPEDDDIADSRAQTYRPNIIAHVYNDSRMRPDNTEIFWIEDGIVAPRIVLSVTKNKISGTVEKLAFDLSNKTVHPLPIPYERAYAEFEQFREHKEAGTMKIVGNQCIYVDAEDFEE